jgi:hypothetical protein
VREREREGVLNLDAYTLTHFLCRKTGDWKKDSCKRVRAEKYASFYVSANIAIGDTDLNLIG